MITPAHAAVACAPEPPTLDTPIEPSRLGSVRDAHRHPRKANEGTTEGAAPMPQPPAASSRVSRRRFLAGTAAAVGAVTFGRAPAVIGQQVRELQVWHTEVEPQTVKVIQDTSIAEFEKKFPGFKVRQQALGWGDLNTKLLA